MLLAILLVAGCHDREPDIYAPVRELNWNNPKLVAMRDMLEPLTRELIREEEQARGRPKVVKYMISIEPRLSKGYAISGDGRTNAWGTGIYVGWSFQCTAETIDRSDTAVVDYALIGANGDLYIGSDLYLWRDGRWISAADYSGQWLDEHDPATARKLRELQGISRKPTSATAQSAD